MSTDERDPAKNRNRLDVRPLEEPVLAEYPLHDDKGPDAGRFERSVAGSIEDRNVLSSGTRAMVSGLEKAFGHPLEPVSYELRVRGGPDPGWHVRRVHFVEAISEPYELVVDVLTDDIDLETDELLGADAELEYTRNTFARVVPGVIEQVDFLGVASDRLQVRLHIVPAFKLLQLQVDTRIFQDKSVPEILQEVLEPSLGQYGRKLDRSKLGTDYLVRDYCVQYGESDFAFASRLMEEEGIAYVFESESESDDGSVERLVLLDQSEGESNSDFPKIDGDTLDQIPIIKDRPETSDCESLRYLDWHRPEHVTKLTTRRFNWKRPDPLAPPSAEQKRMDARGRTREVYVPDTRRRIEDYQKRDAYRGTKVKDDEHPLTVKRFQGVRTGQALGYGASNVTCLRAGGIFEIAEHPHEGVSFSRLLVTRAVHSGECSDREMGAEADSTRFQNTFECMPAMTPFRMQERTPKPRVFGPQTATVTGPEGEEIHTDMHGRIKVLFHWDRLSPLEDSSSCWVRVAQMWAGLGWGTWFLPRVGMEVVVEFLDGNPDRPLVVGCVYNGRNGTPYPLPEEKTKSTIKSNSSIGGGGFNEIRFEDAKGAEEIFIQAQRDQNERVLNNRTRLVKGNEWITIEGNKSARIEGTPVHGDAQGIVQGRETWIDGHDFLDTTHTVRVRAPERIVLEVLGSSLVLEPGSITLTAGDGASLRLDQDVLAMSKARSTVELSESIITNTPASMIMDAGDVALTGEIDVVIKGQAVCLNCEGAGVVVDGSSTVFVGDSYAGVSRAINSATVSERKAQKVRILLWANDKDKGSFQSAAEVVAKDYRKLYSRDKIKIGGFETGVEVVDFINQCAVDDILSLDIFSHGNQNGCHVSRKLKNPIESGWVQRQAHVAIRRRDTEHPPQSEEDAKYIEESMHGLYSGVIGRKLVSYYFNQTYEQKEDENDKLVPNNDTAVLSDIKFDRFCKDAYLEFHGCRTGELLEYWNDVVDNFAKNFSDYLASDCVVVGHITSSAPDKHPDNKNDYRYGLVRVYKGGQLIGDSVERYGLAHVNSSTMKKK